MPGALSDLFVLDLTRVLAGPYGTMILSDFGARVVKVEQPGVGDDTRQWGPPFTASGESAYFLCVNRNKESLTLDLKTDAGRDILRRLAARADVLIENFKVGTMARMGLGYDDLRQNNPGLIYCAITGYGQNGPYRDRPGYDVVIEAQGGIMSLTGPADGEPFKVGVAIVDITAGMYAVASILAALHHRERAGEGQFIDIALFDTQLGWLANVASAYLVSGQAPRRWGNAHATIVPYETFPTADGWMMVGVGNDHQFAALSRVVGRPDWPLDPRFVANRDRVANRAALIGDLQAIFRTRPTAAWIEALLDVGIPCGPVNDVPTALNDPQTAARNMVQTVHHLLDGDMRVVGPVPKLSATPAQIRSAPPHLGEQTDTLLRELLQLDDVEIEGLRRQGVI